MKSVKITATASTSAFSNEVASLKRFARSVDADFDSEKMAEIFENANKAFGVGQADSRSAFSEHTLNIEICGPEVGTTLILRT